MIRRASMLAFLLGSLMLSACNSTQQPEIAAAPRPSYPGLTPSGFKLPEGGDCSGDVARYNALIDNDRDTGNINLKVYEEIHAEIQKAASACSAGSDAQARSLIQGSRSRHGYPAR